MTKSVRMMRSNDMEEDWAGRRFYEGPVHLLCVVVRRTSLAWVYNIHGRSLVGEIEQHCQYNVKIHKNNTNV